MYPFGRKLREFGNPAADVRTLRIELRSLRDGIENPEERSGVKILVASGEWNLLGGYQDRARNSGGAGGES